MRGRVKTDSSAAIGIAFRAGLGGRARHIRVQYLWIQGCISEKRLDLEKVDTKGNIADVLTKHLPREAFEAHIRKMGFEFVRGRSTEAVSLDLLCENADQVQSFASSLKFGGVSGFRLQVEQHEAVGGSEVRPRSTPLRCHVSGLQALRHIGMRQCDCAFHRVVV